MQSKSLAFNYYDFGTREDIAYLVYITPDNIAVQNMNLMFHRFSIDFQGKFCSNDASFILCQK